MPANDETALHSFCARILGWATDREVAVEQAIRSIGLAADHSAALVLLGETDLVPIAHALHRRTFGPEQPFIVCDRNRRNTHASVRSPSNQESGVAAFRAARGGTLCVRALSLPRDLSSMLALVRNPGASVQLIICADARFDTDPFLALPVPILVPSLITRMSEVPRIIDEYAADAIKELGAREECFTETDRQWVLEHCQLTLAEIEKATLRIVAIRMSRNRSRAAERLGMAPVSLTRWIGRRELPRDPEPPKQKTKNLVDRGARARAGA
jgi:DNA-binding protein Fis